MCKEPVAARVVAQCVFVSHKIFGIGIEPGSSSAMCVKGSAQPQQLGLVKSFGLDANPTIVSASIVPISFVLHQVSEQFWCMRTAFFQM